MRKFKFIISFILIFAIAFSSALGLTMSASADSYVSEDTLFSWASRSTGGDNFLSHISALLPLTGNCAVSSDGRHHASSGDSVMLLAFETSYYTCVCDDCGHNFVGRKSSSDDGSEIDGILPSELPAVYSDTVATDFPSSGVGSDGCLYYSVPHNYFYFTNNYHYADKYGCVHSDYSDDTYVVECSPNSSYTFGRLYKPDYSVVSSGDVFLTSSWYFSAPIAGSYELLPYPSCDFYYYDTSMVRTLFKQTNFDSSTAYYASGATIPLSFSLKNLPKFIIYEFYLYNPVYRITPTSGLINSTTDETYNINTRTTNLTGVFGILDNENNLIKVDTDTIVNELGNKVINPVTNTSYDMSSWVYDYTTRTYTVTTSDDKEIKVTYGDENVTIVEDGATYNVYYVTETTAPDPGDGHTHNYTSEVTTEPTCELPGVTTYTCTECGDTYTKSIPALGHDWQVKTSVKTEYDENGELIQAGYTIYRCSRCGEEYRQEAGTSPPSSGDTTSDDESIWKKIGDLIGTFAGGLIGLIEAALSKLLDGLIALLEMLMDKLAEVVEAILSIFDEIPQLFGGFLDFLTEAFGFIPAGIMTLITFGIVAVVAIGIIKALRR